MGLRRKVFTTAAFGGNAGKQVVFEILSVGETAKGRTDEEVIVRLRKRGPGQRRARGK